MSLYARLAPLGPNGLGFPSTAEQATAGLDLRGKTVLVTGCTSGLGLETARVLRLRGAHVLVTARSEAKAREALGRQAMGNEGVEPVALDLGEPSSVRACAAAVRSLGVTLDAIVANAGVAGPLTARRVHGYEQQFFVNHVGHFLLVTSLLDRLTPAGRVVVVSSDGHRTAPHGRAAFADLRATGRYRPLAAYGASKLANVLFAKELVRWLSGGQTANAVHPGVIRTNLGRGSGGRLLSIALRLAEPFVLKSVAQGAATQCWAAVHPDAAGIRGAYLADCRVGAARDDTDDPALAAELWTRTEAIVASLP